MIVVALLCKYKKALTGHTSQPAKSSCHAPGQGFNRLTKMPSHMESAIEYMVFRFHRFAEGKFYLTKEDLGVLIEKESPGFLENQKDSQAVDRTMK